MRAGRMRGVSLVEILISTSIMAGMGTVLLSSLIVSQKSWRLEQSYASVSNDLRKGINWLGRELAPSRTDQLSFPADGKWYVSLTFQTPQDRDGDGSVLDATNHLEWSDPITYSLGGLNGTQILRSQLNNPVRVVANGVTTLRFRRQTATPTLVEINIIVQRTSAGDIPSQGNLDTTVQLRNK